MKSILGTHNIATLALLAALAMSFNPGVFSTSAQVAPVQAAWKTIVIDIACDANTMRMVGVDGDGLLVQGTTFIVNGKIHPDNTILFGDGSCRGTFNFEESPQIGSPPGAFPLLPV